MPFARTTLDSGVTVVTEHMSEVRSVTVGFWFDIGARDEPGELVGTSHFLEHLLFKGTSTRSAKDIANAFDAVEETSTPSPARSTPATTRVCLMTICRWRSTCLPT